MGGSACILAGLALAVLVAVPGTTHDEYVAAVEEGVLWKLGGEERFVPWSEIADVKWNAEGKAILYADKITRSMENAIGETTRRRKIQEEYNTEHGITPTTIIKSIDAIVVTAYDADYFTVPLELDKFD